VGGDHRDSDRDHRYFGQNVPYHGFGKEWGFVLSISLIVAIALGLYVMFKRRDWL